MNSESGAAKKAEKTLDNAVDNGVDKAENLKEKVSSNISSFADRVHKGADSGKSYLDGQVDKTNDLAHQAVDRATQIGHQAADAITSSSDYIKNFDLQNATDSIKSTLKEKPEVVLITVGILGFALGYLLGNRKSI